MEDNKVAVLIEDWMVKFRAFGEGLEGIRNELKDFRNDTNGRLNKLDNKETDLSVEFSTFKAANKQDHQQLMQAIK